MDLLLKQVNIVDPTSTLHGQTKDILIKDGKISAIRNAIRGGAQRFFVEGACVSPGWFDVGALVGDPGFEHVETIESLSEAAATGGFTSVGVYPNTHPVVHSKSEIEYIHTKASRYITSIHVIGAITKECAGKEMAELMDMHQAGAIGFSDGLHPVQSAGVLLRAMEYAKTFNGLIINHPHTEGVGPEGHIHEGSVSVSLGLSGIPELAEEMMVKRDLDLLRYSGSRLHIHNISSAKSVELIKLAKEEGLAVTCSVAAMNLKETVERLKNFDPNFKVHPPLRDESDRKALIHGVQSGTIDFISSNHTPVEVEHKKLEFTYADFGALGLETAFSTALAAKSGKRWLEKVIVALAINPRKVFGIEVPSIEKNNPAEITIFHPHDHWESATDQIRSKSLNSPYHGLTLKGSVLGIIKKGRVQLNPVAV